jgi:hypothetical protein
MDNSFSSKSYDKENEKNGDEENRMQSSFENTDSSSIIDDQEVESTTKTIEKDVDKVENVAVKKGVNNLKSNLYSYKKNNVSLPYRKNVHIDDLIHNNDKKRKNIKRTDIKKLAEEKFKENGQGITFKHVMEKFKVKKDKAQRTLKNLRTKRVLFTAKDLTKKEINLKGLRRENPQRYYLVELESRIIELRSKNVQIDTTGVGLSQRPSSLTTTIGQMKASNLQEALSRLSSSILYIHKLQIQTSIEDKKYYDELDIMPADPVNQAKIYEVRIDQSLGMPNVKFIISPNGTVMIYIINSEHPFRLYIEQDISDILFFLGRVQEILSSLFSDTRGNIIQPVRNWILKECDVNKDIEIDSLAQITLPDMQIPLFERALRGYVKPIDGKAYYRFELALAPNEPIEIALKQIRTQVRIDESILSLEQVTT